jgi:diaminohydroxyphosphoribosylaminopyrimidine deaminase/5-amino-6-(5-phosphoribosylamino)uracil reductase
MSQDFTGADHGHMARALRLAERGLYSSDPNPRVGCVLVRDGSVVGEGWHQRAGEAHAEVHALRVAGARARGATAYVTLEPCSHHGRTPPCCEALIEAGVRRVVAAMQDPNPLVAGRGIARLRAHGIEVTLGVAEAAARALNPGFISRMTRGRPWVRLKVGMSLDGRTALANGASQWITSAEARADVHRQRARSCALLTGVGTLLADDPELTVRGVPVTRQPLRVLLDTHLQAPAGARLFSGGNTLVLTAEADAAALLTPVPVRATGATDPGATASSGVRMDDRCQRLEALRALGVRVLELPVEPGRPGHLDLRCVFERLADAGLNEVLVEAGAGLNGALLAAGLVDECLFYVAPALLGDGARGPASMGVLSSLDARLALRYTEVVRIGPDLRITAVALDAPEAAADSLQSNSGS